MLLERIQEPRTLTRGKAPPLCPLDILFEIRVESCPETAIELLRSDLFVRGESKVAQRHLEPLTQPLDAEEEALRQLCD